jgi:hypothetical protein
LTPDEHRLLTAGTQDGTVRIWDLATGKELCRLLNFRNGDWAAFDAQGRFDASHGGDVRGLHGVVGNTTFALPHFAARFRDRGLVAKHLGFSDRPLREVKALPPLPD